jgi:hypothetical protein
VPAAHEAGPPVGSIGWLWPEETATRGGGPGWRPPRRWRYRAATLFALGAGALLGAGLFIGIALHSSPAAAPLHSSSPSAAASSTAAPSPTAPAIVPPVGPGEAADVTQAAAWIGLQVGTGTVVACDPRTCAALTAAGFPVSQEVQVGLNTQSLSNASVVVVTPQLHTLFSEVDPSLGYDVAPTVLASFGGVSIQPIYSGGGTAYQTALSQDVQDRIQLGEQLLNSGLLTVTPSAQSELAAGEVDPRLLLALQSLADSQPIDIIGFTDSGPGASPGVPFRAVDLSTADPNGGMSSAAYIDGIVRILKAHATFPPYQNVMKVTLPDGQVVAQVQYAAPSPLGLLGFE